ncbi:Ethionine resistance-conferring protein 1 [Escovopsis weberi]|uniref:Ethionine resistance-conferring protein 1 n=1 Tax=Escovopsis weberi TaxID=150374 RepID=A0A0M8MTT9_ESCWE|nr:Ethionine resistance-conferring protein 1 [Escovopsis weberi]
MGPTTSGAPHPGIDEGHSAFASSFRSTSSLAEWAVAQDIADCSGPEDADAPPVSDTEHVMYRRPSGVAYGTLRPIHNRLSEDEPAMTPLERKQSRQAEASLLRDNHVLPPKPHTTEQGILSRLYRKVVPSSSKPAPIDDDDDDDDDGYTETAPARSAGHEAPGEASPLLDSSSSDASRVDEQWEDAVQAGLIRTTWQREMKTLLSYCAPLIITFSFQYSINVAGIFAVGRLGTVELGAISLANLSQSITFLAPAQGLATSLDTLCAQAYGSGHRQLVGLQCQRMACFLLLCCIPVALLWLFAAEAILLRLVPESEIALLSAMYLKVMVFAIPGTILFECGKRFTQAQGLFKATTYVLLFAAPFNILLTYIFVFQLGYGFVGAPMAIAVTDNLLPLLLFTYIYFVDGRQCWGGFSKRALTNWWVMIRLALPGMIMVEAEWFAFEILTLLASRFGANYLAAQSAITTLGSIAFQLPFPMSIAVSTRVANLMGAGLVDAAKVTARVAFVIHFILGIANWVLFTGFRFQLGQLFSNDPAVIAIVAAVLPIPAILQFFDSICTGAHGLLRGIGRQAIGGPANLIAHYCISLPLGIALAFGLDWKLQGLWAGITVGLAAVGIVEYAYLVKSDWQLAAGEAAARNAAG